MGWQWVQTLLDHGADPDQLSYIGNAVSAAVVTWKSKDEMIMKELGRQLKKDDSVELIFALENIASKAFADNPNTVDARSFKILKLLLEKKAKVNVKNQNGFDPLMSSLTAHNYTAFLMLLPYSGLTHLKSGATSPRRKAATGKMPLPLMCKCANVQAGSCHW